MPTDLMMRRPPMDVPKPMTMAHSAISQMGISTVPISAWPLESAMPRRNTPMNF